MVITKDGRSLAKLHPMIERYLQTIEVQSHSTAETYRFRLYPFVHFLKKRRHDLSNIFKSITDGKMDVYALLSDYASHLQQTAKNNGGRGQTSIKRRVNVVKLLFIFHDVEISETKFKQKVRLPKNIKRQRQALDKEDIRRILLACDDKRVRLYLLLISGTGMRAREPLALKFRNLELDADPPKANIDGQFTKTKTDRFVYLTQEFVNEFKEYTVWRHRKRRVYAYDANDKGHEHIFTPVYRDDDLIFSLPHRDPSLNADVESLYREMLVNVNKVIDRVGLGEKDTHTYIRKITRIAFRRFVKTTISDLGFSDYSEWFIGHAGSTYYAKKESEKAQIFKKIEPYLTFLDFPAIEAHAKDIETQSDKITDLEATVQRLEHTVLQLSNRNVAKMHKKGTNWKDIADEFGVSEDAVHGFFNRILQESYSSD